MHPKLIFVQHQHNEQLSNFKTGHAEQPFDVYCVSKFPDFQILPSLNISYVKRHQMFLIYLEILPGFQVKKNIEGWVCFMGF